MIRLAPAALAILTLAMTAAAGDLEVAREALRDGLWAIARQHAARVPGDAARLLTLESFARQGDWASVGRCLAEWKDANGEAYSYYRAVVAGDRSAAIAALKAAGTADCLVEAEMIEADALLAAGDTAGARRLWAAVVAASNASEKAFVISAVNLRETNVLWKALERAVTPSLKKTVALRLGQELFRDTRTSDEGRRLVRAVVKDSPDAAGAREAFLSMAEARLVAEDWQGAADLYHEAVETWPDLNRTGKVHEGRGLALLKLDKADLALSAFETAETLATDDESRALALRNQGEALLASGKRDEAMVRYRKILEKHAATSVAEKVSRVVHILEQEDRGRELYRQFRFSDAARLFSEVAAGDRARKPLMDFYVVLCLYGEGRDNDAVALARKIAETGPDPSVRAQAQLWLAKFLFNRAEWKESCRWFSSFVELAPDGSSAPEALLWSARAALAANELSTAVQTVTRLLERYPKSSHCPAALLVQGEALIDLARFDEAVLVLEGVSIAETVTPAERVRAQVIKADALFAMGADDARRYQSALDAYRAVRFGGQLTPSGQICVSFKIARTLEKLKREDEAVDQYYSQVVLSYREWRERGEPLDDEAKTDFSRAAFRLADLFEGRGDDVQALEILKLVTKSDVPAAKEAAKRAERISRKGSFL